MIDKKTLTDYATKAQTNLRNIVREYLQNLFLASFYQKSGSENFLFKGETALKLIFGSPRFSEDLDFSGIKNSVGYEKILEDVLVELSFENINLDLKESKSTSGGYLAIVEATLFDEKLELTNQISFRPKKSLGSEIALINSKISPSYKIYSLSKNIIVSEKVEALLTRQKPRDLFDLYFILRATELRQVLKLTSQQRQLILSLINRQDERKIHQELTKLLPKSFHPLIKDLPQILKQELERA